MFFFTLQSDLTNFLKKHYKLHVELPDDESLGIRTCKTVECIFIVLIFLTDVFVGAFAK